MTDEIIREYTVGEFRGNFPDVPIEQGVLDNLKELDANPFYAVLPIVPEVGAISNNGLLYDEELVSSIEKQVNENKPGGIFGHLKDSERDTAFPLPSGMWLGTKREGNTLWGKAYVPSGPAREHIRTLMAVGGRIATSIYGRAKKFEKVRDGVKRAVDFKLESLDFAPASRAALGNGAIPHVTAEMEQDQESDDMTVDRAQVIAELTLTDIAAIPIAVRDAIVAEASKQDETQATIAELTNTVTAKDVLISELNKQIDGFRMERLNGVIDTRIAELTDWTVTSDEDKTALQTLRDLFRSQIVTRLGDNQTVERVAEIATAAWEDLKPIAEMMRDRLAGPAAFVGSRPRETGSRPKLEDTSANREAAMSQFGIQI